MSAIRWRPHCSSSATNARPASGRMPRVAKKPGETMSAVTRSGLRVAGQVDRPREEGVEMRQRAVLAAVVVEIRRRGHARRARRGVDGADRDETLRILIRERPEQQGVHDAEHHRVGADPNGERREHDRGEPRAAPDQPRREAHVLCGGLDHTAGRAARDTASLVCSRPPSLDERVPPRFVSLMPARQVVVDVHLQVRIELVVEARARRRGAGTARPGAGATRARPS